MRLCNHHKDSAHRYAEIVKNREKLHVYGFSKALDTMAEGIFVRDREIEELEKRVKQLEAELQPLKRIAAAVRELNEEPVSCCDDS